MSQGPFPNDENGDVLRRLAAKGDDLSRRRNIDFTVVFPTEFAANDFAEQFRSRGYGTKVELGDVAEGFPWDVVVVNHMLPTHQTITDFERELGEAAHALNGRNDGWGCITQAPTHLH